MQTETDAGLMLSLKEGQEISMELLLKRYRRPVAQYIYRLTGNRAIAEELTQNVFVRIYRSRATYQPTAKFTNWLFCIANHLALNWLRDRRREGKVLSFYDGPEHDRERQIPDSRPTAEQTLLRQARLQEVRQAIEELPDRQRNVIMMQRYQELEYTQIAAALNCSPQTVKSLIYRAHNALRARLAS